MTEWGKYQRMKILVMFDIPVATKEDKRNYRKFREFLLNDGYWRVQYSVYFRDCCNRENSRKHVEKINKNLPKSGEVRILEVTEKQWLLMKIFLNVNKQTPEPPFKQLELF